MNSSIAPNRARTWLPPKKEIKLSNYICKGVRILSVLYLFKRSTNKQDLLVKKLERIKAGEDSLRDELINEYKPFIIKVLSKTTGRYIDVKNGEELSIGLMAFNEAITSYKLEKESSFLTFAELIIKRRIIDYYRSNENEKKTCLFSQFVDEEGEYNNFEERYLVDTKKSQAETYEIKEEIVAIELQLAEFDIKMKDLVNKAPKHIDSKRHAIQIAKLIAENQELYDKLIKKKSMPMNDLMNMVKVDHKTIERNRKFIIAICLILRSDLEILKGYIRNTMKGGEN